jgi:DNA-binding response OmpR family regulator
MKKILLVEDDKTLAMSVAVRLKANGYDVLTAHDALSGVSTAVKQRPDLMVLDISMPAGGGISVAERVKRIPLAPPIIFMTAGKEPGLREKAMDMGAVAFFEKPYEEEDLLAAIREALGEIGWGRRIEKGEKTRAKNPEDPDTTR